MLPEEIQPSPTPGDFDKCLFPTPAKETNVTFKQKYLISAFGDWRRTPLINGGPATLGEPAKSQMIALSRSIHQP